MTASEREQIHMTVAEAAARLYGQEGRPAFSTDRRRDVAPKHKLLNAPLVFTLGVRIAERSEE